MIKYFIGILRLLLKKCFNIKRLHIDGLIKIHPSAALELIENGEIFLGKRCSLGKNVEIASVHANVKIGNNVHIGDYGMIISREEISVGNGTIMGPHVYIYDHDHLVDENGLVSRNQYKSKAVVIGENVWIGTNTVILKGTIIGDNAIIGAGSVISGIIPPNTKVIQKREQQVF